MARSLGRHRHSFFATVALLTFAVAPLALAQSAHQGKEERTKPAASASASASRPMRPPMTPTPTRLRRAGAVPAESAPPGRRAGRPSVPDDGSRRRHHQHDGAAGQDVPLHRPALPRRRSSRRSSSTSSSTTAAPSTRTRSASRSTSRKDGKFTIILAPVHGVRLRRHALLPEGPAGRRRTTTRTSAAAWRHLRGRSTCSGRRQSPMHLDFEYGFGLGIGVIFGKLYNDWVYQGPTTRRAAQWAANGNYYAPCNSATRRHAPRQNGTTQQPRAAIPAAHSNATTAKVGNYVEPNWFNGGSVPGDLPAHRRAARAPLQADQAARDALRPRHSRSPGFWFGLSADYGLEDTHSDTAPASKPPTSERLADSCASDKSSRRARRSLRRSDVSLTIAMPELPPRYEPLQPPRSGGRRRGVVGPRPCRAGACSRSSCSRATRASTRSARSCGRRSRCSGLEGLGVPRVLAFGALRGGRRYMLRELVEGGAWKTSSGRARPCRGSKPLARRATSSRSCIAPGSSTATSSRRTSSSAPTGAGRWSTWGSRRRGAKAARPRKG